MPDALTAQLRVRQILRVDGACGGNRRGDVFRLLVGVQHAHADRAVEQPGIEISQPEMVSEAARQRAFAGSGGPVDGDDHAPRGAWAFFAAGDDEFRAERAHQRHEARETRCNRARVIDHHRLVADEAEDEKTHRDAVVEMRRHRAAAGRAAAFAVDDEVVAFLERFDAVGFQPGDDGGKPVAFLHP